MSNTDFRINGVPVNDTDKPDNASSPAPDSAATSESSAGSASTSPTADTAGDDAAATQPQTLEEKIVGALKQVFDPEIPVDIYELGLIYGIEIDPANQVCIKMTLTSPACPVAESLPLDVRARVGRVAEVAGCEVELVWEPTWSPDRMSDVAKLKLGML
jgi:FeS assembly SUF system protein